MVFAIPDRGLHGTAICVCLYSPCTTGASGYASAEGRAKHSRTRPYTPRTNGKAERFIQAVMREWAYAHPYTSSARRRVALVPWLRWYNERRPHGGIGGAPPITRLQEAA